MIRHIGPGVCLEGVEAGLDLGLAEVAAAPGSMPLVCGLAQMVDPPLDQPVHFTIDFAIRPAPREHENRPMEHMLDVSSLAWRNASVSIGPLPFSVSTLPHPMWHP